MSHRALIICYNFDCQLHYSHKFRTSYANLYESTLPKKTDRMKYLQFMILVLILACASCKEKPKTTIIAFGSCSHEFDSLQQWDNVMLHNPSAWIWLGDNIYGDTYDMDVMKRKYSQQKDRLSYQKLMSSTTIYGIWDDHDYGINDGGKEYVMKDESKQLMLDFLDVPTSNEVYQRQGAYQSYMLSSEELEIKLILLDTRYFRDSLEKNPDAPPLYKPNPGGTILGEEQWNWLQNELTESTADIHLIGSSIQLIPNDHGYEKWGNFPAERERFMNLIVETNPARPIILSGDRHIAEFSKMELEGLDFPLYEFTASGLTHTWGEAHDELNQYRIGNLIIKKNFGLIDISYSESEIDVLLKVMDDNNEMISSLSLYQ